MVLLKGSLTTHPTGLAVSRSLILNVDSSPVNSAVRRQREDMDERREEAKNSIWFYVWGGWHSPEEVFNIIDEEVFDCDGEDEKWLRAAIKREFVKKREAERAWPTLTSFDRLDIVFTPSPPGCSGATQVRPDPTRRAGGSLWLVSGRGRRATGDHRLLFLHLPRHGRGHGRQWWDVAFVRRFLKRKRG